MDGILVKVLEPERWFSPLALIGVGILLIVIIDAARSHAGKPRRIGQILRREIVVLAVLPMLSLGLVLTDRSTRHLSEVSTARVEAGASAVSASLEARLEKLQDAVETAALSMANGARLDEQRIRESLLQFHGINKEFISTLVADSSGQLIGATIARGAAIEPVDTTGIQVGDREYFREPMRTGTRYLSNAFRGRGLGKDIIVAASAPVHRSDGSIAAVIEASTDFSRLGDVADPSLLPENAQFVILDPAGHVAASNEPETFLPLTTPGPESRGEQDDGDYIAAQRVTGNGWTVLVRLPQSSIRDEIAADLIISGVWIASVLVLSLILANVLARRVSQPLITLAHEISDYEPPSPPHEITIPKGAPSEVGMLARHFYLSARRLNQLYETRLGSHGGAGRGDSSS
jgi:HAMP domain-containing protein